MLSGREFLMRRILLSGAVSVALLLSSVGLGGSSAAFASNVCPVIGGPSNATIKTTPAMVPDKTGNPAHGGSGPGAPGDVFWN